MFQKLYSSMCGVIVMNENLNTMTFSIEKEREEYHQRRKKRKIVKLYIALALWAVVVAFLFSPYASYKMMKVNGNVYLSENEIIEYANIKHSWWWIVDGDKVKQKLEEHKNIDNVSVSFDWKGIHISILEKYPIATLKIDDQDYYIVNTSFDPVLQSEGDYKETNLIDITELNPDLRNNFIRKYSNVDLDIRSLFYKLESNGENGEVVLKGKFNDNAYFNIEIKIDYIDVKLETEKFNNIKGEILGKIADSNVKYDIDNPVSVKYNFTDTSRYEIE